MCGDHSPVQVRAGGLGAALVELAERTQRVGQLYAGLDAELAIHRPDVGADGIDRSAKCFGGVSPPAGRFRAR
jgi:hypothetical protein